ncbi:TWiK family of potassium channel [Ditylenchus destructor]|nr:TWiK family of potassium channel [Ditylenchus destructor]
MAQGRSGRNGPVHRIDPGMGSMGLSRISRQDQRLFEPGPKVEVKELVKIISQIRAKYPEKQQITSFDILKYVQELNGGYMSGLLPYGANPYRTFNIFLMQQHRRDTIAFMPQSIEALKFADEMDAEEANDWLLQQPFEPGTAGGDSAGSFEAMPWSYRIRRSDPNTFIPFLPFLFAGEHQMPKNVEKV